MSGLVLSRNAPELSLERAARLVEERWGLSLAASPLPGEWDLNVLLTGPDGPAAVLKVSHAGEERAWLEFENAALARVASREPDLLVPRLLRTPGGEEVVAVEAGGGRAHLARLVTVVPGRTYARVRPHDAPLLRSLGESLARLGRALAGLEDPRARRVFKWDLLQALWIEEHLGALPAGERRERIEGIVAAFREALPRLLALPRSLSYNDANDHNVMVENGRVAGFVDFGDLVETPRVCDLAIACAYAALGQAAPLDAACEVVRAYHGVTPLDAEELALLFLLVETRLAVSVVNSALQRQAQPDNDYLAVSEAPAWDLLERTARLHPRRAPYSLRAACGLPSHPAAPAVNDWLADGAGRFAPVLGTPLSADLTVSLDLSAASLDLGGGDRFTDADVQALVERKRRETGARIAVGRHLEPRLVGSPIEEPGLERPEPRTVHLGADLFVPPGTPVSSPLDGVVAAVADGTVVLRHETGTAESPGVTFFTLFDRLDPASLGSLSPGERLARGAAFARAGTGAAPRVQVQLLLDPLDLGAAFPRAARPSDVALFSGLCPDPGPLLGLGALAGRSEPIESLLARRRRAIAPSLSVSYGEPLHVVRGFMQHLVDAEGRSYLDMVNNVPHVGHANPRVVAAAARQLAVLNTNTRYLHPLLEEYAEALTATLPPPLSVCFFVNSGSEANELALRLCRTATGRQGTVVLDVGYHGNTSALVEISPYKHEGPGGSGPPPWVRKVALPDPYRGIFRGDGTGPAYAALLEAAMDALEAAGHPVSAFVAESMPGCAGQIVLPDGYLAEAFRRVRARGGLCVADEVQVGMGRAGSRFWAFETQGVVPDVVTLGKPIGNGWPLGAVVTTPEVARAFANGMEYFNTFGGNPASLAVGMAVLDEVRAHDLQGRALRVGTRILEGLRALGTRHEALGDARGLGLYIGAELVRSRTTRAPHAAAAAHVANRLRSLGILVSTDGPDHNVLKIKPPLVVTEADAGRLLEALDQALAEDAAQP